MQRSRSTAVEVSASICSELSRKVVPGIVPVSDSVFLAWPFNAHVWGEMPSA